jgi:predicted RNA-binding Zn-ribbon protein involved in translation (DUF1610 family)
MKCVCGYSDDRVMDESFSIVVPVTENGAVTFRKATRTGTDCNTNTKTQMYACPKCGTVRIS